MPTESGCKIGDLPPVAELVDCAPPEPPQPSIAIHPEVQADAPVRRAREATIEQTGADPPPAVGS